MLVMLAWVLLSAENPAAGELDQPDQVRFFETSIRPLLAEQCFKCHGANKQWGSLRLDSRETLMRGGDSGPAIVPGKPADSLLVKVIRHEIDGLQMPKDSKLSDRQIQDLVRWVEMGAAFPDSTPVNTRTRNPDHWAFQPMTHPDVPAVKKSDWPRSDLDRFILARIEAARLSPAPVADKRTLIRRVTFDLTGLPPAAKDIDAFLAHESDKAFARVVDRLLESPGYGERWGRHWLDVARYADSNGLDENVVHGNAWRYRDYVVDAFNHDKPFNRFVMEQLAGDLLPFDSESQRNEQLIATGFLGIGPKVLAETDEAKMRMDIIDEQLDTAGRAFLGLTLGCARCHDHKFDPIDTADYYGLAGIFKSTQSMRKYTKLAEWYENLLPSAEATAAQKEFDTKVASSKSAIEAFVAAADKLAREGLAADAKVPDSLETIYPEATKTELKKLRDALAASEKAGPLLPSAMGVTEDKVTNLAVHIRGNPLKLGDVVSRRTPPAVRGLERAQFNDQESGRKQLAQWLTDPRNPLTARVFVNRVWCWHFGKGIVPTTDNFGLLGEVPSHPDLLDWLATRFISDGWSVKSLHRLILNSSTYQQASTHHSSTDPSHDPSTRDPENRLLARADVRRLEAEAIRDSLLAVSGQLDGTLGGSLLKLKNRDYFFDHTSKDLTTYDTNRRSLYLPIVRNNVFPPFQLFDFPDPAVSSSRRASTVVAPQALMLLNSDFVIKCAADCADRVLNTTSDDTQRLSNVYVLMYGREPTSTEREGDLAFLTEVIQTTTAEETIPQRQRKSWQALCQILFAASEFIYVK